MYLNVVTSDDPLKSTIRIEKLIEFLKSQNIDGCAVANTNMFRLLNYYRSFKKNELKPVIALKVKVNFGFSQPFTLNLYAMNLTGYNNLLKVSSGILSNKEQIMPYKWLKPYSEGLLVVIPFIEGGWLSAPTLLPSLKEIYGEHLYIGISRTDGKRHIEEEKIIELAAENLIPIVAFHESYYLLKDDAFAYEVLKAIEAGQPLDSLQALDTSKYLPTAQQMQNWFEDKPLWVQNANQIINLCQVEGIGEYDPQMPEYPLNNGETPRECLHRLAYEGLKIRCNGEIPPHYKERLEYELNIISQMGYDSYFLIVADFVAEARRRNILIGPGRGSSASSLVAYSLYITEVDPIEYSLLFERFLNPYRVTLPDIDIDFNDARRYEIIQYLKNKYGEDYVSQIITFGNLGMKGAARDVGRMLKFESSELNKVSKLLEKSKQETLKEAYENSKELRDFVNASQRNKIWFETSCKLEGIPRNTSTHAAGVVLTPKPLIHYLPLKKNDDIYLTQWTMEEVESIGLLKIDLLGLTNLRMIDEIMKSLEKTYGVKPTLETIPLDDKNTYKLLQQGLTDGIFQLESAGITKAVMDIKPTNIQDIIAINALYRPGPLEFIPTYARRKHGLEEVQYPHPILEPILKETYGIIIYQEQILQIAQVFAGYSIGEADLLRRAIGKKKREILEEQKELFVKGAIQQGHDKQLAEDIYDLIVRFADYGFAKCHATSYSLITYYTAYFKANYPSHFYAVQLNRASEVKRINKILTEMKSRGVKVLPIDIRNSSYNNTSENKAVRLGFKNIQGITEKNLAPYLKAKGQTTDLFDYAKAVGSHFNKEDMEKFIKAGAFDHVFNQTRNTLLESLDRAAEYAPNEDELFVFGKPTYAVSTKNENPYNMEVEVCGFSITSHPVESYRNNHSMYKDNTTTCEKGKVVKLLGYINNIKETTTKRNEPMSFLEISDEYGTISVTVFPKEYTKYRSIMELEKVYVIEGKVQENYGKASIIANHIIPIH